MIYEDLSPDTRKRVDALPEVLRTRLLNKIKKSNKPMGLVKAVISVNKIIELYEAMSAEGEASEAQMIKKGLNTIFYREEQIRKLKKNGDFK